MASVAPANGYAQAPHSLSTVTARSESVTFAPLRTVMAYTPSATMAASSCVQSMAPLVMVTSPLLTSNALPLPEVPSRVMVKPPKSMVIAFPAPGFGSMRASSVTSARRATVSPSCAAATASARLAYCPPPTISATAGADGAVTVKVAV